MVMSKTFWAGLLSALLFSSCHASSDLSFDESSYAPSDIIRRDVAVIGGGSTGTYTAVRLGDYNKSVVVIEPKNHLGGHAETYTAPNGYTVDIGVIVFAHLKQVTDYFARFDVPLVPLGASAGSAPTYVDFSTGKVAGYTPPGSDAVGRALKAYGAQLAKYPALQDSFNLTYPVAPDLLLPFGDFVKKYDLGAMMPSIFITNQGYAPLLSISTLYMLKYLNSDELASLANGFLTTEHHNIQELYHKAAAHLGQDVLLNSSVIGMQRSSSKSGPARILVQTPKGKKLVVAKRLVSTAPPLVSNLKNYDLSPAERSLFGQFRANGYYTGVLNNSGLSPNASLRATAPGRPYGVPQLPGPYSFSFNKGAGLTQVYYASPDVLADGDVKADILANLERYKKANGITAAQKPSWVVFSSHAPFNLMVPNEAIRDGFYDKLFALQGERGTFHNGAAWHTQDSSVLWKFTDTYVLPKILASF